MGKWANNSTKSRESRKMGKVWKISEREEKEEVEGHASKGKLPVPRSEVFEYEPSNSAHDPLGLISPPAKLETKETICIDNPAPPTAKYAKESVKKQSEQIPTSHFLVAQPQRPNDTPALPSQADEPFKRWDMTPHAAELAQNLKNAQLKNDFEEMNNLIFDAEVEQLEE